MKLAMCIQAPGRCLIEKYWVILYKFIVSDTATLPELDAAITKFLHGSSSAIVTEVMTFSHQIYDAVFHDGPIMDRKILEHICTYYWRKPISLPFQRVSLGWIPCFKVFIVWAICG